MRRSVFVAVVFAGFCVPGRASNLGPRDICVLYNKNLPTSKAVAEYYCSKRGVPLSNLIPLDVPDLDEITRADYEKHILIPVRLALKDRRPMIRVLLTVYGVPLRIGEQVPSPAEKAQLDKLRPDVEAVSAEIQKLNRSVRLLKADVQKDPTSPLAPDLVEREALLKTAAAKRTALENRIRQLTHVESTAAVDSELMLMWWPAYPLARWIINPLYWQVSDDQRRSAPPVMMTCRLDGPGPEVAKRLVDDAIFAERTGLHGKVYVDARGIKFDPKADPSGSGYGGYDESFREAAQLLADRTNGRHAGQRRCTLSGRIV